jgi:hypothetical protein
MGERRGRPKQENENQGASLRGKLAKILANYQGRKAKIRGSWLRLKFPVILPEISEGETRKLAAAKAGFGSEETYRQAKTVVEKATPELVEAVDQARPVIMNKSAAHPSGTWIDVQRIIWHLAWDCDTDSGKS